MAQIESSIAMGFRPVQIESPINQMAAMAQLEGLQQQRQQNAMKMQEYQRGTQQRNALAAIHADPNVKIGSPEYLSRVAQEAPDLYEGVATRALQQAELGEKIEERTYKNFDRKFNLFKSIVPNINSEGGVYQYIQAAYNDPDLKPILEKIQPLEAALESNANAFNKDPDEWRMRSSGVSAEKLAEIAREKSKPVVVSPGGRLVSPTGEELFAAPKEVSPSEMQKNYAAAKEDGFKGTFAEFVDQSRESEAEREYRRAKDAGYKGSFLDFKRQIAVANKVVVNTPAPVTPVTIVDPKNPDRTVVVDARTGREIGQGLKEPSGVQLSAKEKQAREAKYPQATAAVKTFETKSEALAKDLEKLANHPGLSGISGLVYGRTPGVTKDARAAQALYDSIVARGGFAELQAMRAASPTGGALGNVSNQEGQYLRDAFAALSRTQDTADLAKALKDAAESVRGAKQRTREAYDMTYEYKTGGATNAPDPLGIR
jgi:hypothetical protein